MENQIDHPEWFWSSSNWLVTTKRSDEFIVSTCVGTQLDLARVIEFMTNTNWEIVSIVREKIN